MAEFKFACPSCNQHIAADENASGQQVTCPSCQAQMLIPCRAAAPPPVSHATNCPHCGRILRPGAPTCQICGFDLESGQLHESIRNQNPDDLTQPRPTLSGAGKTFLGFVALVFIGLGVFTSMSPVGLMFYLVALITYATILHLWVLVAAFMDSLTQGLLAFFVPFYTLYFTIVRCRNAALRAHSSLLFIVALATPVLFFVLPVSTADSVRNHSTEDIQHQLICS